MHASYKKRMTTNPGFSQGYISGTLHVCITFLTSFLLPSHILFHIFFALEISSIKYWDGVRFILLRPSPDDKDYKLDLNNRKCVRSVHKNVRVI